MTALKRRGQESMPHPEPAGSTTAHHVLEIDYHGRRYRFVMSEQPDYILNTIASTHTFYEIDMLEDLGRRLSPNDLVLDIGAHVGNHSVYLAGVCGCEVLAFEPFAENLAMLDANIALNGLDGRVRRLAIALGAAAGCGVARLEDAQNRGSVAIDRVPDPAAIPIKPLDEVELSRAPAALKIDVEGAELAVLEGAQSLLRRCRPMLYLETMDDDAFEAVVRFLDGFGYQVITCFNATPTFLLAAEGDPRISPNERRLDRRFGRMCIRHRSDLHELRIRARETQHDLSATKARLASSRTKVAEQAAKLRARNDKLRATNDKLRATDGRLRQTDEQLRQTTDTLRRTRRWLSKVKQVARRRKRWRVDRIRRALATTTWLPGPLRHLAVRRLISGRLRRTVAAAAHPVADRGPAGHPASGKGTPKYLFICGCPRTGTTALVRILNRDPRIALGNERFRAALPTPGDFAPEIFLEPAESGPRWAQKHYRRLQDRYAGAAIVGDKYPPYCGHLDTLAARFPGARFIFTYRDLYEVASSFNRRARDPADTGWPSTTDYRAAVNRWNDSLRAAQAFAASNPNIYILRYADFFSGHAAAYESLYEFLGIAPQALGRAFFERHTTGFQKSTPDLTDEERDYLERHADRAAEAAILERAGRQDQQPRASETSRRIDLKSRLIPFLRKRGRTAPSYHSRVLSETATPLRNAFLIGAMKCGTNTLYHTLKDHPQIIVPHTKELDYFVNGPQGEPYLSFFHPKKHGRVTLDGTTQYSKYPVIKHMPQAIYRLNPDALFIYLMRDPIERIESNIAHHIARQESITLDNWRESPAMNNALSYSSYYSQIGLYISRFSRDQIFLGIFEEFIADQKRFVDRVCAFLGVDPDLVQVKEQQRNPRRTAHGADRLKFTPTDDIDIAGRIKSDIDCLVHVFELDLESWWPRYFAAIRHD